MKLLLAIQSHEKANTMVARHCPYYLNAGADEIHGIGTTNGNCIWPDGVASFKIGEEGYTHGDRLPRRIIDTIGHCLSTDCSHFCIIESDAIFLKKIPHWEGMAGHLTGGRLRDSHPSFFMHCPWFMDRPTAERLVEIGRPMLNEVVIGRVEENTDFFLAWVTERAGIVVNFNFMKQYTQNSLNVPHQLEEAKQAIANGVEIIHGVKTQDQLDYLFSK